MFWLKITRRRGGWPRGWPNCAERAQTNIVIFDIAATEMTTAQFSAELKSRGVLANGVNAREMRMVTHYDVSREQIERTLQIVREILKGES